MKKISQSDVKKTYRFYAPFYDIVFGAILEPGRKMLAREVCSLQPAHLLEIGVGTGLLLTQYPHSSQVRGIDLSEEMLLVARQKLEKYSLSHVELDVMDAENLSFDDGQFDCVVLPYVLSVTPDPQAIVREARRVCKRGGTIFILNHFSGSKGWYLLEKLARNFAERIGFRSDFSFDEHILGSDWVVEKVQSVNLFGLSKLVRIRNSE